MLAAKGCKTVHAVRGASRENVTLILAINAVGQYFQPGVIFKGKRLAAHWCEGAPDDWLITCTDSSMINTEVFYKWLVEFCKVLEKDVWSILFLDGHVSHISLAAVEYAEAHKLLVFQLPSHSSHLLQPLDLCALGMVKRAFTEELTKFTNEHSYGAEKQDMCALIHTALVNGMSVANVTASFAAAGLCPFDPQRAMRRIEGASGKAQKYTHAASELPVILLNAENTAAALGGRQLRQLERNGHTAASVRVTTIMMSKILQPKKRSTINRKRAGITKGGWLKASALREIGAEEAAADAAKVAAPKKRKAAQQSRSSGSSSVKRPAKMPAHKQPPKLATLSSDDDSGSSDDCESDDSDRGDDGAFRAAAAGCSGDTTPARTRTSAKRVVLGAISNFV